MPPLEATIVVLATPTMIDLRTPGPEQPTFTIALGPPTVVDMRPVRTRDPLKIEPAQTVRLTGAPTTPPSFTVTPAPPPRPAPMVVDLRPVQKPVAGGTVTLASSRPEPTLDIPRAVTRRPRPRARSRRSRRTGSRATAKSGGDPPGPPGHGDESPRSEDSSRSASP